MSFLHQKLYKQPTSSSEKLQLLKRLWSGDGTLAGESYGSLELDEIACLAYYQTQCSAATHDEEHLSAKTHDDIMKIVDWISHGLSKRQIIARLESNMSSTYQEHVTDHEINLHNSIDLAARLASMIEMGAGCCGNSRSKPVIWMEGSLKDFIKSQFQVFEEPTQIRHDVKLDKIFNGRNLERIAGLRIIWTSNLIVGSRRCMAHRMCRRCLSWSVVIWLGVGCKSTSS